MSLPPSLPPLSRVCRDRIFGPSQDSNGKDADDLHTPPADHLVFIGYTVLQFGIMIWLAERYPKHPYTNLAGKLTEMMSKKPASWSKLYKLPSYFPVSTIQKPSERTLLSKGDLFAAYIGAIHCDTRNGVTATNNFIKAILNFEEEEGSAESDSGNEISSNKVSLGGMPSHGSPVGARNNGKRPTISPPPLSPGENSQNALNHFNGLLTKRKVEASWGDESSGPDHVKTWTTTLAVEGRQFEGTGGTKRQARAVAADLALKDLKWI